MSTTYHREEEYSDDHLDQQTAYLQQQQRRFTQSGFPNQSGNLPQVQSKSSPQVHSRSDSSGAFFQQNRRSRGMLPLVLLMLMLLLSTTILIAGFLAPSNPIVGAAILIVLAVTALLFAIAILRRARMASSYAVLHEVEPEKTAIPHLEDEDAPSFLSLLFGTNPETSSNDFDLNDDDENDFGTPLSRR